MLKHLMKALKLVLACSMAVGISAYIPEIQPKEVKATEAAQLSENTKWTGTISALEPRNDGDTYHIYTGEELAWVAEQVNKGYTFANKDIILESDIDLNNHLWTSIGESADLPFSGDFNGQGHKIKNLKININGSKSYGLFGNVYHANIQNLEIDTVTIGNKNVNIDVIGVLSANAYASTIVNIGIKNVDFTGADIINMGGIVGIVGNGTKVIKCSIENSIFEAATAGPLIGIITYNPDFDNRQTLNVIADCYAINNTLTAKEVLNRPIFLSGFIGAVNDLSASAANYQNTVKIFNCYTVDNHLKFTSNTNRGISVYTGGLIGNISGILSIDMRNIIITNKIENNMVNNDYNDIGTIMGRNEMSSNINFDSVYYSSDTDNYWLTNKAITPIGAGQINSSFSYTPKSRPSMQDSSFLNTLSSYTQVLQRDFADYLPNNFDLERINYNDWVQAEGYIPSFKIPEVEEIEIYPTMVENNQDIIFISNNIDQQVNALVKPYCSQREAKVTWSITPDLGLSISETGLLSAKNAEIGAEAELQATYNGITKTVKIRVVNNGQIMSLKINNPGFLEIGSTKKLTVTTYPSNADLSMIRWYINDEELNGQMQYVNENELASLDSVTGLLTMKQQGKITITVKQDDVILDEITLLIHSTTWDGISSTQPAYENDIYHITTGAELRWIAEQVNVGNTFAGKTILLENSIDLGGKNSTPANWQVIGSGYSYFSGIFDGQGFTIRNLYSVTEDSTEFNGLFGWLPNAVVKNLNVDGFEIGSPNSTSEKHKVAIIGYISGQCKLENIHIENGKVISNHYAGGLAGIVWSGTDTTAYVNQCKVENVTVKGQNSGGLIGSFKGMLLNSSVSGQGSVQGNEKSKELYIGGLIGTTVDNSTIVNSYADTEVGYLIEGSNSETVAYTGGLIGCIQSDITLNNIYANGTIINKKSQGSNYLPGAIAGKINIESITLDNLNHIYWNKEAEHQNSSGVINGELKAFGTGDTSLSATNKSTSCTKEFFLNNLSTTLNANAVDQTDWLGWTSDGKTMPQLTNSAPVVIEIKQDDLYLRRNESVVLETIMKPYNSTKKIDVTWELEGDTSSDRKSVV